MARLKPEKPYRGILVDRTFKVDRTKSADENFRAYEPTIRAKMDALFDHFEIDRSSPKKWELLTAALACTYVPGFLPSAKKIGRKARNGHTDAVLLRELAAAEAAGKSVNNKVRLLVEKDPRFKGKNPEALRQRYYRLSSKRKK